MEELDWPDECRCPPVNVGFERFWGSRVWNDACPEHGVGTDYFRNLTDIPYGYAGERETSREDWLNRCAGGATADASASKADAPERA